MAFASPVKQMIFALKNMANFSEIENSNVWPDINADFVESLLLEASKLADSTIAPLNHIGDKVGSKLEGADVITPPGFKDAYIKFIESSWGTISGSPEYGGQGLPRTLAVMTQELWNSANMSFSLCPMLTQGSIEAISQHGTDTQKKKYLPKLLTGEWSGTMNLTEPQAGSDVGSLNTSAIKNNDDTYGIKGTKIYITFGEHDMSENIIHLVLARIEGSPKGNKGISLFIVPKFLEDDSSGEIKRNDLKCIGLEKKLGIHASPTCVMSFGEKDRAVGYLLGQENNGLACMFTMMNNARLNVGMQGVGISERALQQSILYSKERKQGKHYKNENPESVEIINHPDVSKMLLKMKTLTEASRAICYDNAISIDLSESHPDKSIREKFKLKADLLTPISKSWSTDVGVEVASLGIQIHGGMGFVEETGVAQFFRDSRIAPIYEGTNGIQAIDLVMRKLLISDGEGLKNFMSEFYNTLSMCIKENNKDFQLISKNFSDAFDSVKISTEKLSQRIKSNENYSALFVASDYLNLLGITAGAHYLIKGALSLKDHENRDFFESKKDMAIFFSTQILPNTVGLSKSICSEIFELETKRIDNILGGF
ncbi:acyl-CoA dehydrogenase family protein [Hyphomicrobiales bacterium]|nr:acyl-CoA dehydrogenase family protein [Hyphomicrobiales bacterium]